MLYQLSYSYGANDRIRTDVDGIAIVKQLSHCISTLLQWLLLVFQTSCLTSIISQSVHNHSVSFAPDGYTEPVIVDCQITSIELFVTGLIGWKTPTRQIFR